MKFVAPYLVRMAETDRRFANDVVRLLTTHPPWRAAFFIRAPEPRGKCGDALASHVAIEDNAVSDYAL